MSSNRVQRDKPYFYIEDLFPDTIYRELQANLPPSSDLPSVLDNGRVQAATPERLRHLSCRRTVRLNNNEAEHLDPAIRPYWISLAKTLGSPEFMTALLQRFAHGLLEHYADPDKVRNFESVCDLVRDTGGYSLGPHTDHPRKVAVLLIYLAEEEDDPALGTSIYTPRRPGFTCNGDKHYDFEEFERVYTAGYRPNCAFAFLKTQNSFHGVEPVAASTVTRDLIQFSIGEK